MKKRAFLGGALMTVITLPLLAQGIHVRTVPVIAGNQAEFQPSLSRGMGNLSIAFVDPLGDPFVNPAKAHRLQGVHLFSTPTRNSWSNENGRPVSTTLGSSSYPGASINSIPFGAFFRTGDFFAGGLLAYQGFSAQRSFTSTWGWDFFPLSQTLKKDIGNNAYLFGLVGTQLPNSKVSIAASVAWGDYQAIDGVNLLYPGSYDIRQEGSSTAYKVGVVGELSEEDQMEFVVERALFKARHDVTYSESRILSGDFVPTTSFRTEVNRDESNQWVLHGGYKRRLGGDWKIGGILTVNWKDHPKIPNYALANIPRDPGTTVAYNIGVGMVQEAARSTWGFEYIYEPITSNTWAEAGEVAPVPGSPTLPPNFKTIENFFDFHNHILRVGVQSMTGQPWLNYRLGAQLHFYQYDLNQNDNINRTSRFIDQDWIETTLTGGLNFKFSNVEFMYTLQLILGNGMVGTVGRGVVPTAGSGFTDAARADFIIAPSGQLVVDKIPLVTQQITFVYRLD